MSELPKVMRQLKKLGSAQTRKIYGKHGAPLETMFGVKVGDLKPIAKAIKGQHQLALDLYATGNSDAMHLAGLVAEGSRMTKTQLNQWASQSPWYMISEFVVPKVASQNKHARTLANKWIKSRTESIVATGWATWSCLVSELPDEDLDLKEIKSLLKQVGREILTSANRVRYAMNGFVISVGCCVTPLSRQARATAKQIGKVSVDVGETSCKVPVATDYILKVEKAGMLGIKRSWKGC